MKKLISIVLIGGVLFSCKKKAEDPEAEVLTTPVAESPYPDTAWTITGTGPHLIFKFKFDSTQVRLDNLGQPSTIPAGHGAFSPIFNKMASHYIELAQNDLTAFGAGTVLYYAPETSVGGSKAIKFNKSTVVKEGVPFYSIPLSQLTPGATYKWLRLSLSYQNYDIAYKNTGLTSNTLWGTVASFIGYSTYVTQYRIKDKDYVPSPNVGGPNVNHLQGYWGFETLIPPNFYWSGDGQAQAGATTVVNPNNSNSPVPAGSCVVTAQFTDINGNPMDLTIPVTATNDIIVTVSISTNKSFEWIETGTPNGYYEPVKGTNSETPVDMGVRGMIPKVQY